MIFGDFDAIRDYVWPKPYIYPYQYPNWYVYPLPQTWTFTVVTKSDTAPLKPAKTEALRAEDV